MDIKISKEDGDVVLKLSICLINVCACFKLCDICLSQLNKKKTINYQSKHTELIQDPVLHLFRAWHWLHVFASF